MSTGVGIRNENSDRSIIFIYGPPGSGKSSVGRQLASDLELPYYDLDVLVENKVGKTIPEIFQSDGEPAFRFHEKQTLRQIPVDRRAVVALGGGSLLDLENREYVEGLGTVICLRATQTIIQERLQYDQNVRPLLNGNETARLIELLSDRKEHYNSFPLRIDINSTVEEISWQVMVILGWFYITGMGRGYRVEISPDQIHRLGYRMRELDLNGPVVIVSDTNVAPLYAENLIQSLADSGYTAYLYQVPAGELSKNISTVIDLWKFFLRHSLERNSTVVALGGGVVGDIAGFAAATFLRGINWVFVPTTVLAMVDASLGGKTGVDLPEGKNLIGAFYPPRFVLADHRVLATLPLREINSGMAEVVKHGIIADPILFRLCRLGWDTQTDVQVELIRRAIAVKVKVILADPYEVGQRALLNLGHTLGHGIERASNYKIRHGEAVSIGMVAAARYSEKVGLAESGLADEIAQVLSNFSLRTYLPQDFERENILEAMKLDKKRKSGSVEVVLPVRIGEVQYGIPIQNLSDLIAAARKSPIG